MRVAPFVIALACGVISQRASAAEYVNDPLTDATHAGRGAQGGAFSGTGWTTTTGTDAVWYEIADALPEARIEYDLTGVSVGGSLSGADHDILCAYQAPTGSPEPIVYAPDFRNNDFKVFTRIFGSAEPGRGGAMKIELHVCPRGEPWHHDTACPESCYTGGLAYPNGMTTDIGWDPAKTYRMFVAWGAGKMSFGRDGAELASVDYSGTYAPQPLRVRIGSPRHKLASTETMPLGLTFANVKVTGTAGTMTPVCGMSTPVDAGLPSDTGAAIDASTPPDPADAGGAHVELTAIHDVTADQGSTGVYADTADLAVEGDGARGTQITYLRFPPPSGKVVRATLRLRTSSSPSATGGSGAVHGVSDGTWTETTLTWANKPAFEPTAHGPVRTLDPDQTVEWDVTSIVARGIPAFAIVSTDTNGAHYLSKEASAANAPRLIVDTVAATTDDASVAETTTTTPTDATVTDSPPSDGGLDSKREEGGSVESAPIEGDGCGCRTTPKASPYPATLALIAALALTRRKRDGRWLRGGDHRP